MKPAGPAIAGQSGGRSPKRLLRRKTAIPEALAIRPKPGKLIFIRVARSHVGEDGDDEWAVRDAIKATRD